jgi:uncharacterized protein (DUF302 family)
MTIDGLTTIAGSFGPNETLEKLETDIAEHGMSVMARVDHATAAAKVGLILRPTTLVVFGNPKAGTAMMQSAQTTGIDLPLKVLVWEDKDRRTWLSYNEPEWIARRHGIQTSASIEAMHKAVEAVVRKAASQS